MFVVSCVYQCTLDNSCKSVSFQHEIGPLLIKEHSETCRNLSQKLNLE